MLDHKSMRSWPPNRSAQSQ